ncbi:ATP-dependent DNA helicase Q5-like [Chironomus tepperi]|uniref:ATP-dependent DNA helicase Q5-like n=1 Tax=Chironomus tepperi TaxID=113505 RepID=UPI00391FC9D9
MATQAGKSLCYQLPRTALQRSGVVLVIAPNISVITNQVAYLSDLRIPVTSLTSVTPRLVRRDLIDRLKDSNSNAYQFLFVTPEMLIKGSDSIRDLLENMMYDDDISLIVMDDAHMIIDTGTEFRQCFSEMGNLRKKFPKIPWVALTTASTETMGRIGKALSMEDPKIIKGPSTRKNIFYDVKKFPVNSKIKELIEDLIEPDKKPEKHVTKKIYDSGIIYCQTNQEADRIAAGISRRKVSCACCDRTIIWIRNQQKSIKVCHSYVIA